MNPKPEKTIEPDVIKNPIDLSKLPVKSTPPVKFKDKPTRSGMIFDFMKHFGFIPTMFAVQKVKGKNNTFIFSAVLTPEELAKEKAKMKGIKGIKKKLRLGKKSDNKPTGGKP